jgi:hypothetical protein
MIRYLLLFLGVVGVTIYFTIMFVIFLIHSFSVLLVLPLRMVEEEFRWDYSKPLSVGPTKRSFWQWVFAIYSYEMRGDQVWESIYDSCFRSKWSQKS